MKTYLISTALLLGALSAKAQYTRSLFYEQSGSPIYQTIARPLASNDVQVFSTAASTEDTLRIRYRLLTPQGDVTTDRSIELLQPAIGQRTLLSGAFDEGNSVYTLVLLSQQSVSTQQIGYVQINLSTATVLNSYFPSDMYKAGFSESQLLGSDLVTYLVSSASGLQRIAKPASGFTAVATENVDPAYTLTPGVSPGRKQSELLLYGGSEHLVAAFSSGAMLYRRNAAGNYVSVQLASGGSAGRLIDLTVNGSNTLVAAVGDSCFVLDGSLATTGAYLLTDPNHPASPDGASEFFYRDGSYYRSRLAFGNVSAFSRFDDAFGYVSTHLLNSGQRVQRAVQANGRVYLQSDAPNNSFNDHTDVSGTEIDLQTVAVISASDNWPAVDFMSEYHQPFTQNDLRVYLGQSGQVFSISPENTAGAKLLLNDTLRSLVYTARTFFAAKTTSDELVGMGTNAFGTDLVVGPYTASGSYSPLIESQYDRGFYVTRQMIEDHVAAIAAATPGYIAPHGIREWPAHGNTALGQAEDLAPFRDSDGDGTYEPNGGDYPLIYGDQCYLTIAHQGADHPKSAHMEVHSYYYTFACQEDSAYTNTIFAKQLYIPRNGDLDSVYAGVFMDSDLGNFSDDYVGTHAELGLIYNYNADLDDQPNAGQTGFGANAPAQGILLLKGAKMIADTADNAYGIGQNETVNGFGFGDGINDNEYYTLESSVAYISGASASMSDPATLEQNFNTLLGFYRFGDAQQYCGTMGDPTGIDMHYAFTGDSDPLHSGTNGIDPGAGCSELLAPNFPGDRRIAGSTGGTALSEGDTLELVFAYVCAYDSAAVNTTVTDPLARLFDRCASIKADYGANSAPCGNDFGTIEEYLSTTEILRDPFTVYPNPTTGSVKIDGFGNGTYTVTVCDVNGRLLSIQTMNASAAELSLEGYSGALFLVAISDGYSTIVKRVLKN